MAIVKMKRLRLMLVRSQKEELLRELARLGCVQVTELGDALEEQESQGLVHRESSELTRLKTQQAALERAVELLDRYAPENKPLLSAKPELESRVLLDDEGLEEAKKLAEALDEREDRIRRIGAEESRQRSLIESLTPWESLDLPLETESTVRCAVVLGTISRRILPDDVQFVPVHQLSHSAVTGFCCPCASLCSSSCRFFVCSSYHFIPSRYASSVSTNRPEAS